MRTVQNPRADEAFDKLPHEFSGGHVKRLMIALALMPQPDLVIADGPTTALGRDHPGANPQAAEAAGQGSRRVGVVYHA